MKRPSRRVRRPNLTAKQIRFVQEYILCLSGKRAAIKAGYPQASAAQVAYENLRKPQIHELIQESLAERQRDSNLDRDAIIGELILMAGARGRLLFRAFHDWSRLPRSVRQRSSEMDTETRARNFRQRLELLIERWKTLDSDQPPSASGRHHCNRAITWLQSDEQQKGVTSSAK